MSDTRNTTEGYQPSHRGSIANVSTHRSPDESQVAIRDAEHVSENGRTNRKVQPKKLENKLSTASMGIFAPPLNPRPKTKHQRDKLIKKHASPLKDTEIDSIQDDVNERMEVKTAMSETKDVTITTNETNKEANFKLTFPVLIPTKEKTTEQEQNGNDASSTVATSNNETHLATVNICDETKKEAKEEMKIKIPDLPKPRYDFDRTFGAILPDIRINNYTVPSPIQEEDEERRSSVAMEDQRAESVAKVSNFSGGLQPL